ncbi:APC family permease [Rufibacter glacialis]|uniref:APC family permease n=1 Tax=Rufibacter glacialis TaxID=1259555 RepID=A0A5M8QRB0_9BACT|nr:amino acid permease [Rufibacter glacialis]KAA6437534.1 amino acid permease [Rufibacter glacialis]GGK58527.1 amino acid transporter [Rufibacter glacialis]
MSNTKQLNRSLGLRLVVVVVIGNIIGSGVYKKVAPMAAELHSPGWVLICWVLGGIITLFGALSNAEIAGLLADTGGEYAYYKRIYNRFFAFIYGWSLFTVIQTAAISSLAYVFAQSLHSLSSIPPLLPSLADFSIGGVFYPFADFSVKLTAILLILFLTWVNTKGLRAGAGLSTAILVLVFAGIFLIIFFGATSSQADLSRSFDLQTTNQTPVTFSAVFAAMLSAFWAYQGWAAIGFVGGEIKDAKRNIPRGITIGVLTVIVIYLLVNATYLSLLPIPALEEVYAAGNQIAAIEAVKSFWETGGFFISVLILITTLGCTNATILASCRTYFAMAREGLFFQKAASLNQAQVPANSLVFQCVWACVLVLSGTFDQLTDMIIFAVFIYYGATTLGVFILRKKMPDAPRPYKVWGYPVVPAIMVLFCVALFCNTIFVRPREAGIGMILMLTGIPMYWWFMRRRLKKEEPVPEEMKV